MSIFVLLDGSMNPDSFQLTLGANSMTLGWMAVGLLQKGRQVLAQCVYGMMVQASHGVGCSEPVGA